MLTQDNTKNKAEITLPEAFRPFEKEKIWLCSNPQGKPVSPIDGNSKGYNLSEKWGDFAVVKNFLEKNPDHSAAIVVSPGSDLICIDLDDVIDESGSLAPWAKEIVQEMDSYTEISTSGRGLHIFAYGEKKEKGNKTTHEGKSVEIYSHSDTPKPIKITGNIFENRGVIKRPQEAIDSFYQRFFPKKEEISREWTKSPDITDEAIIELLRNSKNGSRFKTLFDDGNIDRYEGDESNADLALVNLFAFYTQDPEQIDRLFRKSNLYRDKWKIRKDYRKRTIEKALDGLKTSYQHGILIVEKIDLKEAELESQKILETEDPCKDFSLGYLPTLLREYISIKSKTTEAHPIMLTQSILCMTSSFLKRKCFIPKGEFFQDLYSNVWMLNIHDSGGFKSTALSSGLATCDLQEKQLISLYRELDVHESTKGNGRSEDDIVRIQKQLSEKSVYLPNRVTAEALIDHLSKGFGGVIKCSEFGGWLSSLEAKYNGDLKAIFTDFYDVPGSYVYLSKNAGRQQVEKPFITICGMAALPWVTDNMTIKDVESGFFARFLIYWPKDEKKIPKALPETKINEEEIRFDKTIHDRLSKITFGNEGRLVFEKEARDLFEEIHDNLYKLISGLGEDQERLLLPFVKRWSPTLLKLAMLIRVYDETSLKSNTIKPEHLLGATSIIQPAINSTIKLLSREFGETPQQKKMRKVRAYIARKGGIVTRSILLKSGVLDGGHKDYDYVLDSLEARGEIHIIKEGSFEKPTLKWKYALRSEKE